MDRTGHAAHYRMRGMSGGREVGMRSFAANLAAFVIGPMLIAGSASAQDCGPFFWLCQRPAGVQVQPNPPNEPRGNPRDWDAAVEQQSGGAYGRAGGEPFSFLGQRSPDVDPRY